MTDRERARQYLEDYAAGQIYRSARMTIDKDQIIAFAGQFDPQPYHLDEEAAHKSVFSGLTASGWHTAALSMRLLVDSEFRPAHGILGVGVDELRWLRPVRPGDSLYVETEVLEVRPSKSEADRPDPGAHDDVQSKRRAGANVCRQPSRSAPASRRLNVPPT